MNEALKEKIKNLSREQQLAFLAKLKANKEKGNDSKQEETQNSVNKMPPDKMEKVKELKSCQLSYSQERFWFSEKITSKGINNIAGIISLKGNIDIPLLECSLNRVVRDNPVFRSRFFEKNGVPYTEVVESVYIKIKEVDFSGLAESKEKDKAIETFIKEEAVIKFDLEKGEVLRTCHIKISDEKSCLLNTVHHIISDAWSIRLFVQNVFQLYNMSKRGLRPENTVSPFNYFDYSVWNRKRIERNMTMRSLFWKKYLEGMNDLLDITAKRTGSAVSEKSVRINFDISEDIHIKIKEFCRKMDITPFMFFYSALNILLYRYSGQKDILLGIPVAGRDSMESARIFGCFINTIPARVQIDGKQKIDCFLKDIRKNILTILQQQDFPFEKIVQEVVKKRDFNHSPLIQCLFNYVEHPSSGINISGVSVEKTESLDTGYAVMEMDFQLILEEGKLRGWFNCREGIIDKYLFKSFVPHYLNIITSMLSSCNAENNNQWNSPTIDALDFLSELEKETMMNQFNGLSRSYKKEESFLCEIRKMTDRYPEKTAIYDNGEILSYKKLSEISNKIANYLIGKSESIIGLLFDSSWQFVAAALGILKAGCAFTILDPKLPQIRIETILQDAAVNLVMADKRYIPMLPDHIKSLSPEDWDMFENNTYPEFIIQPQALAYVLYTSGTTGTPKGVMIEHDSITNLCLWMREEFHLNEKDNFGKYVAIGFDPTIKEIFPILTAGGSLYIIPEEIRHNINILDRYFTEKKITAAILPTPVAEEFLNRSNQSLKKLFIGGEKLNRFKEQSYDVFNCYGPTEYTVCTSFFKVTKQQDNIPIGKPVYNTSIYILNQNNEENYCFLQPVGVAGELCVSGTGIARGYLNREELTGKKFIDHPFKKGEKLYKTGDLARFLPDGNIEFLGRIDHQVKIHGFRVEPEEIENRMMQVSGITASKVEVREKEGNNKYLCAFYTGDVSESKIISHLKATLPYYMVPSYFTHLESFEYTANGKIDAGKLPSIDTTPAGKKEPPSTDLERELCDLWKELIKTEEVGITDNFYEIGGHSLLVVRLLNIIAEKYKKDVSLMDFMENPYVKNLAQIIQGNESAGAKELVNLSEEAHIDPISSINIENYNEPQNILITGATGFVGSFLLSRLLARTNAKIFALVRAENPKEGYSRLEKSFANYGLDTSKLKERVIPLMGCLSRKYLGMIEAEWIELSKTIDTIYHNGAYVHHFLPYEFLKESNVSGTKEIIAFASLNRAKRVNHISSLGIFTTDGLSTEREVTEFHSIDNERHFKIGGYNASKWVSEKIIQKAIELGLDCRIFRLGRVTACSQTGRGNKDDYFSRIIRSCLIVKKYPLDLPGENCLPVDILAEMIVSLSLEKDLTQQVFHLVDEKQISVSQVLENGSQEEVEPVSFSAWLECIERANNLPIEPYIPLFKRFLESSKETPDAPSSLIPMNRFSSKNSLSAFELAGGSLPELKESYYTQIIEKLKV